MPKTTVRAKVLKRLREFEVAWRPECFVRLLYLRNQRNQDAVSVVDRIVRDLVLWVENNRYLEVRVHEHRCPEDRLEQLLYDINNDKFRKYFRLSRPSFLSLLGLITERDLQPFRCVDGKRRKASVTQHLLVLLRFLGINENACTLGDFADFFSLGIGTVKLYLDRAVDALLLLKAKAITWPGERECQVISSRIPSRSVFQHCVGYLDGTIFPFECKPEIQSAEDYFSRKSNYDLNAQVVCDDQCRIRYIYCGWPVSVHYNRA